MDGKQNRSNLSMASSFLNNTGKLMRHRALACLALMVLLLRPTEVTAQSRGWINIDNVNYPGVDRVLDVTTGLPYSNDVSFIFAEHFVEHLSYTEAAAMLRECRRVLLDDGVLRLSTPNLDWVWASHYKRALTPEEEIQGCFALNGAFRAWASVLVQLWNPPRDASRRGFRNCYPARVWGKRAR